MMKNGLFYIFSLLTCMVYAQNGKLEKADSYYARIAYSEAANLYEELIDSEVDSPKMRSKLANCYFQIGESLKAEEYYASVVSTKEVTSEDVYNYAQSLKENGKYNESDTWMKTFHSIVADDSRGKEFASNPTYLEAIEAQGAYFSVAHLAINTKHTEFGGYPTPGNKVYLVSNRKKRIAVQRFHSFNNKKFLDLYSGSVKNGTIEDLNYESRNVNKKYHEGPLTFSPNGDRVYFTRNNMSSGKNRRDGNDIQNLKIYYATVDAEGAWSNEKELAINSKDYSVGHPTISADGKTLYFASDMPGGHGGVDIYKMEIFEDGTFGDAKNLGTEINTEGQEMFPWVSKEGLLFFASDGHLGLGGLDVFVMLVKKDGSFQKLMNLGKPVNSAKDDFGLILNSDNLTGYFSSNRDGGSGDDDIYSFQLLRPLKSSLILKGLISDKRSLLPLPGAIVELRDASGLVISSTKADENGAYSFELEPDLDYLVFAQNQKYFDNQVNFTTKNLDNSVEELEKNLALDKDPGLSLYALVTDAKTKQKLEGVSMKITDNMTGQSEIITTDANGDYLRPLNDKKLDDRGSYNFSLTKEGYIPKTVTYNALFDKEGVYNVHSSLDLTLDPMVSDLSELIEINPINFDLGKWNIRDDAKKELDKIVEIMNKYPEMQVELGSHTDCRASKAFNMSLSDKRAKASAKYIQSKITNPTRIYGKGYGESKLLNGCECEDAIKSDCSEAEHEKNRRTEFKVISVGVPNVGVQNNSPNSFDQN